MRTTLGISPPVWEEPLLLVLASGLWIMMQISVFRIVLEQVLVEAWLNHGTISTTLNRHVAPNERGGLSIVIHSVILESFIDLHYRQSASLSLQ